MGKTKAPKYRQVRVNRDRKGLTTRCEVCHVDYLHTTVEWGIKHGDQHRTAAANLERKRAAAARAAMEAAAN